MTSDVHEGARISDPSPLPPRTWRALLRSTVFRSLLGALTLLGLAAGAVVWTSGNGIHSETAATLGRTEPVTITTPDGSTLDLVARVDTGADRSSIDRAIVDRLGIDTTGAPEVTVGSALGSERRPLIELDVVVAGEQRTIMATVADRSGRSAPVLLGIDALTGFMIDVSGQSDASGVVNQPRWTVPTTPTLPPALLLLLPLATAVVVALRMVVGLQPLGIFAPVLLAMALIHAGLIFLFLLVAAFAATFVAQPALARLHIPRHARLAVMVGVVVLVWLVAMGGAPATLAIAQGVPVIVTVVVLDRLWGTITEGGSAAAIRATLHTILATGIVWALLAAPTMQFLATSHAVPLLVGSIAAALAAGSYRGLRLAELKRFRTSAAEGPAVIDLTVAPADQRREEQARAA